MRVRRLARRRLGFDNPGLAPQGPQRIVDSAEYDNLAALERDHWYYAGKRRLVRAWIERLRPPSAHDVLLDCGAGTGLFAAEMERCCRVLVLDDHEESLRMLRARFPAGQVLVPVGGSVPLPDRSLDYLTALDVLEHIPDDAAAVRGFARLLRAGGLAVVTVPAGMALWSDWDVALHHQRRYSRRDLCALFGPGDWEIVHVNYTNVVVYPAVWLLRRWRGWRGNPGGAEKRAEDRLPPRWLNALLRATFVGAGLTRIPFPFGVSLLLAARRRG